MERAFEPINEGVLCLSVTCCPEERENGSNVEINRQDDAGEGPAAAGSRPAERWEVMPHEKIHYPSDRIECLLLLNFIY